MTAPAEGLTRAGMGGEPDGRRGVGWRATNRDGRPAVPAEGRAPRESDRDPAVPTPDSAYTPQVLGDSRFASDRVDSPMCGIAAIAGQGWRQAQLEAMVRAQHHRGPDRTGLHVSPSGVAGLGHNRLSIIDLSAAGAQPMSTPDGRLWLSFNGEIYNYLELRDELSDYPFRSRPTAK